MSPRFFAPCGRNLRVDEAIAYLRRQAKQVETIYYAYRGWIDEQHLLGSGIAGGSVLSRDRDEARQGCQCGRALFPCPRTPIRKRLAKLFRQHQPALPSR